MDTLPRGRIRVDRSHRFRPNPPLPKPAIAEPYGEVKVSTIVGDFRCTICGRHRAMRVNGICGECVAFMRTLSRIVGHSLDCGKRFGGDAALRKERIALYRSRASLGKPLFNDDIQESLVDAGGMQGGDS